MQIKIHKKERFFYYKSDSFSLNEQKIYITQSFFGDAVKHSKKCNSNMGGSAKSDCIHFN